MLIKTKVSFFYYYEEEKIAGTYLEMRHPFDLVLHNNLDFVIILSNFDIKTPVKDQLKQVNYFMPIPVIIFLLLDLPCFASLSLVSLPKNCAFLF